MGESSGEWFVEFDTNVDGRKLTKQHTGGLGASSEKGQGVIFCCQGFFFTLREKLFFHIISRGYISPAPNLFL